MSNVTYLFGAGASANTIPIVNQIQLRFSEVVNFLNSYKKENFNINAFNELNEDIRQYNKHLDEIIADLDWLAKEAKGFQTIDTLAKKYYLTNDESKLIRLKKTLITYFTLEQLLNIPSKSNSNYSFEKRKEFRYESFFASIFHKLFDGTVNVNPQVKIINWNYDQQVELALKTFAQGSINQVKELLQVIPNEKSYNKIDEGLFENQKFGCIKLNGTAVWSNPTKITGNSTYSVFDVHHQNQGAQRILGSILAEYDLINTINNGIELNKSLLHFNFSWESDRSFKEKYSGYYNHLDAAYEIARNTNILVIVGYSFPVFNREMDKLIIDKMDSIKKIYIQDPKGDEILGTLKNGFKIFENYKNYIKNKFTNSNYKKEDFPQELPVMVQKSVDQFLIPFELS